MRGFIGLSKRNLLLYFKDVQAVIFSLLTSIIVFVLYLLFLKNNYVEAMEHAVGMLEGLIDTADIDMMVNGLLLTGIMGSALVTVPYNCLTTIVKDRENRIDYDISATPMKRWQIILSYFVSSWISAVVISSVILTVGLLVLSSMGDICLSASEIARLYGVILLGAVSATAFFMILMLFFKSPSASGAFFGMLSAAAGFVIGAYIPVSDFSDTVQTVCNICPASHVTVLFRKVLLSGVLEKINQDIGGIDKGAFAEAIRKIYVFQPSMFGELIETSDSILYIGAGAVICILVMIFLYSMTYKRK